MKHIDIWTDGGAKPNPKGNGGWAAILKCGEVEREYSGSEPDTTNNRMELTAALQALMRLKNPCSVHLRTDSQYLANCFKQGWIAKWKKNGWRTANGEPVKNQDIWEQLEAVAAKHTITWEWVRGHSDDEYNNRCDRLATEARVRLASGE